MAPYRFIAREMPLVTKAGASLPVRLLTKEELEAGGAGKEAAEWVEAAGFKAADGALLLVPGKNGRLAGALFGLGAAATRHPFAAGRLPRLLPEGDWHIEPAADVARHALAFAMGAYRFETYKKGSAKAVRLALPADVDAADLARIHAGVTLARDLINTPANDMGPSALERAFRALASHYKAKVKVVAGDELVAKNFPMIHAVGRAAADVPRLLEMRWGKKGAPKVTLVGKGVCFDTGGLDIKPSSNMLLMKKDMGGAANVMGLALMIMDAKLPVDLRVLVPAVENSVSGGAFRPGDVLRSRKGVTVQIDNTDAEGRLVLGDALAYACEEKPDLLIDMATLTGAARVALGPDLPPFYTDDEMLAGEIASASAATHDPLWRMPLYQPYEQMLDTKIADITNAPSGGFAGSITAALFLKRFVEPGVSWCHLDIFGWVPKDLPHATVGGEAQGIRALYEILKARHPA
jgi:Leucyl aminopeptidase